MVDGIKGSKGQPFQRLAGNDPARAPGAAGGTAPVSRIAGLGQPALSSGREALDSAGIAGVKGIARDLAIRPPVDVQRVADVRLAIAAGTYRPDADSIATAMVAQEVTLLTSRRA
jgi:flagellar biosynthesis anti-sigma factor FlgM